MRVVVLGATGGTGLEIVRRSLARGHSVTAFVRSADRLKAFHDQADIRQGDLLNIAQLEAIIKEHDAVLSGFGPRQPLLKSDAHLLEQFAKALTTAMQRAAVKRVVVISTAFLFKDSIIPPTHLIGRLFFSGVVSDSAAMERVFLQSNLDWTIVRPPQLTDGPFTGKYRVRLGHLPRFGFKVSREDVADFFVKSLEQTELPRNIVGVSN
jgi:putative NADH-flavin reductase